jgi:Tfp pilus assembly pilus retraction ATPase PilT
MKRLNDLDFVDLYIGKDFVEVNGAKGLPSPAPLPAGYEADVEHFRVQARTAYERDRDEESYVLHVEGQMYRVTCLREADGSDTFIFRKSQIVVRPITDLGFHKAVVDELLDPQNTGMVLIVGAMAAGKTSTLASISHARNSVLGGIGVAIENPTEMPLRGRHGNGRFLQICARRREGGYKAAIKKALRTGASMFALGEILDPDAAYEGAVASFAGHFVGATMHADSIVEAVQKMEAWCGGRVGPRPGDLLANALSMVIWQNREVVSGGVRLRHEVLFVRNQGAVKAKIASSEGITDLRYDVTEQAAELAWQRGAK